MRAGIGRLLSPPVFEGDEQRTRTAALLNTIVLSLTLGAVVALVATLLAGQREPIILSVLGVAAAVFAGLVVVLRLGYARLVGLLVPLVLWVGFSIALVAFDGIRDTAVVGFFLVILMAGLVSTVQVLTIFGGLSILTVIGTYVAEVSGWISTSFDAPPQVSDVAIIIVSLIVSGFLLQVVVGRITAAYERARQTAEALGIANEELQVSRDTLAEQAVSLERRARYLQATATVAREAASATGDFGLLLSDVVTVIDEQLGYYHVGLFLLDSSAEWVELRAASSAGGQRMLERGHRLRVGSQGVVGWVARQGVHHTVSRTERDLLHAANPDLPETRSEVALPLRTRGDTIGVLDVQSTELAAFSDEDVAALQVLADQVAVAIDNARLLQQTEESVETERRAYGEMSRQAWLSMLRAERDVGFVSDDAGIAPAGDLWEPQMSAALQSGETTMGRMGSATLSVPIRLRGQVIGVVDGRKPDGSIWTPEETEVLEAMTEQLNVALEGARLYRETQRRVAQERTIGHVAGRIRESLQLDEVLRSAAEELRQALELEKIVVRLGTPEMVEGLSVEGTE